MILSRTLVLILTLGTGLWAGLAAAAAPGPQTRSFRDWQAVCDNGGDCFAFTGGDIGAFAFVRIHMPAGPDAEPGVAVGAWGWGEALQFSLVVDGVPRPLDRAPASEWAGVGELRGAPAREMITAMAAGRSMDLSIDGQGDDLSLSGVSAALLWIDERQGRLRTTTALLRQGPRPASEVPPAPELPEIQIRPATISQFGGDHPPPLPDSVAARPEIAACRDGWEEPDADSYEPLHAELAPTTQLWGAQCFTAAYNTGHILFLTDHLGGQVRQLILPGADEPVAEFVNVEIGNTITQTVRARGLGDCGLVQQWRWARTGFELALEQRMDACVGMPPELWPTVWRTR